jgi:hypothetical protein
MVREVTPNSSRVREVPGAHNDEAMGEKVDMDMIQNMRNHFCPFVQCLVWMSDTICLGDLVENSLRVLGIIVVIPPYKATVEIHQY